MWQVLALPEFEEWLATLDRADRKALDVKIRALEHLGPALARPYADVVRGSKYSNMKELRARETLRVLYAFDPGRRAVLLIGGDKKGDGHFYGRMIARADRLYEQHLAEMDDGNRERS